MVGLVFKENGYFGQFGGKVRLLGFLWEGGRDFGF